ncbi:MAG: hypothetical protein HYY25_15570 [Candidatus Wallbacteria bacterium]|nr:hypothetical protein [Candidatus Wallbacteria bacterium]
MSRKTVTLQDRRGFTLTATAVAAALFAILLLVSFGLMSTGQRRTATGLTEADLQQQATLLVYRLTQEVTEARELLLPMRTDRAYPFVAFRTLQHEIVLYAYQKATSRILRQVVDPATWQPAEERVLCNDVDSAAFSVDRGHRLVRLDFTLGREVGGKRETLPISTAIGVRGW